MVNPNYLGFSLDNILDLLKLYFECEEFPEYLENLCENMADFAKLPVVFTKYPDFLGSSLSICHGNQWETPK